MKLVRYARGAEVGYGVLEADGTIHAIEGSPFERFERGRAVGSIADVRLLAPVVPSKVVGVGSNFYSHLEGAPAGLSVRPGHNTATDRVCSATQSSDNHEECETAVRT